MNHLKCTLLVFSAVLLTACGKNENIVGKWMQAVPGLPELKLCARSGWKSIIGQYGYAVL